MHDEPDWNAAATDALALELARWAESYPHVAVTRVVQHAPTPAELLIEQADDAALLVVGARGDGGLPGLDLGWTARNVIAHASSPTAVVHHGDVLAVHARPPRSLARGH